MLGQVKSCANFNFNFISIQIESIIVMSQAAQCPSKTGPIMGPICA